jgi:predicted nucleic acid-binding protein
MTYLLDTCVLSEYTKSKPSRSVIEWLRAQPEHDLWISQITLAEIRQGIVSIERRDPSQHGRLSAWLTTVEQRFSAQTLPTDAAVWQAWAALSGESKSRGVVIASLDALLIATAQVHKLTIVTRNIKHFSAYPLLFNPWEAAT